MTLILLPKRINLVSIDDITRQTIGDNLKPLHRTIEYGFENVDFIDSTGITVFANLIEWCATHGVNQSFLIPEKTNDAIKFLDDSLFFKKYTTKKIYNHSTPRETTVPLQMVKHAESHAWIENNCVDWLSRRLHISRKSLVELSVCLKEIFNNIKDHSAVDTGCIFIQHHPKLNKVKISISDFGIGIPSNVRRVIDIESDGKAILKAMEEGFTTRTTNRNRGVGLHLLQQTVVNNGGTLTIRSGKGKVFSSRDGSRDYSSQNAHHYPGTALEIELYTNHFDITLADEEDFSW
ncbi:ATP-binding protein [Vogesella indigofera]|uniref:ATP-binding protein n=1 Tax=Vogesella indigofera TaxID=45465 RepID=A0ABT5I2Q6_VOGIN|nr:ATP-binding protein [Vogesella indigofera]MDC7690313.1 ATP-binding protein [Vogesella indigofera]